MSTGGGGGVKYTFVHDLNFAPTAVPVVAPAGVVQQYVLGPANRVEWLQALITPANLNQGTDTTDGTRQFARGLGRANDDAGHIVASRLGGLGHVNWNIFPQSSNINRGAWKCEIEALIYNAVY